MPRQFRWSRWWLVPLLAACLGMVLLLVTRSSEPVYQGRRLGSWLRGHPREYWPAVSAVGTNALPYLLAELQAVDSRPSQWVQRVLSQASIGPFWRTARDRHYHARLALQILDTNAVPALLDLLFSQPLRMNEGDPAWSAALALSFVDSPAAQQQIVGRLAEALRSPDAGQRRNACLALPLGPKVTDQLTELLVACSADTDAPVRAAALRALIFNVWPNKLAVPALIARLEDEQAKIRRLAIVGLSIRTTNAVAALPALHRAFSNELTRVSLDADLNDGGALGSSIAWSPREIRRAIREAIRVIDPQAAVPPADP